MLETGHCDTLAIIPLRAGSKGLPGKNLRPLAGKPLYRHSVDQALRVVGRCIISTNIPEVLNHTLPATCQLVARPEALAQDETPMAPVLVHLFEELKRKNALPKIAILLQATSPLRQDEDIRNALTLFKESQFELVMSVIKADPGVLKYGYLKRDRFTPISSPEHCFANRQALPNVVRPNGAVYVFSPEVVLERGSLATESIGSLEMPEIRSIDIDTQADLQAAEDYIAQQSYSKAS